MPALLIDGDSLRQDLCRDLDFSVEDRIENVRRAGAVAILADRSGISTICALISPHRSERDAIRCQCREAGVGFLEVYLSASFEVCEKRDPKGLYQKARAGLISEFTGLDSPYEPPINPELTIPTACLSVEESFALLKEAIEKFQRKEPGLFSALFP